MCSVISPHNNRYPSRPYIHTDTTCAVSFHPHNNRYPSRPYIQMVAGCTLIVNKSNLEVINCTTHKKFTSLFCIPYSLLLIVMGFQNKPQNINEKKKTQGKTSEMIEWSGIEIFITGFNGPSNKKADNHDNDDNNNDDDDELIQSIEYFTGCMLW